MRTVATIFTVLLFGACNGPDISTEREFASKIDSLKETNSSAPNEAPNPPTSTGFSFSTPGEKAAYKEFLAQRTDASKAIYFHLNGFFGDTKISKSSSTSALEMKWTLLAESQDIVNQFADTALPNVDKNNSDFDQITFKQIDGCRSYGIIKSNDSTHYTVQGTCISHPSISIPIAFNNKIFLNGKLIHDVIVQ